jgi:hypothetical protein
VRHTRSIGRQGSVRDREKKREGGRERERDREKERGGTRGRAGEGERERGDERESTAGWLSITAGTAGTPYYIHTGNTTQKNVKTNFKHQY